jgi:IMP dehydrogenase/GMP reductase
MATLIDETRMMKEKWEVTYGTAAPTKIIADGGISNFDDIQKCLALGADLVMSGNIFARAEEACGEVIYAESIDHAKNGKYITQEVWNEYWTDDGFRTHRSHYKPYREYYGMSTKRAQKETGGSGTTTSEGISRPVPVEYPIAKWADNMKSYLVSVMSYTDSKNLSELSTNTELIINLSGDKSFRK